MVTVRFHGVDVVDMRRDREGAPGVITYSSRARSRNFALTCGPGRCSCWLPDRRRMVSRLITVT